MDATHGLVKAEQVYKSTHTKITMQKTNLIYLTTSLSCMQTIQDIVYTACDKTMWNWKHHIDAVMHYADILAKKTKADATVCELASLLHDIAKIEKEDPTDHHVKGARRAEEILQQYNYDEQTIHHVKECIMSHSSDTSYPPLTLEAEIIANADALSHFDNFIALTRYFLVYKKLDVTECTQRLLEKYNKAWNKLTLPDAREIANPQYKAIQTILRNTEEY